MLVHCIQTNKKTEMRQSIKHIGTLYADREADGQSVQQMTTVSNQGWGQNDSEVNILVNCMQTEKQTDSQSNRC